MIQEKLQELERVVKKDVKNLLKFWEDYGFGTNSEGFIGVMNAKLEPQADSTKLLVLGARLVWTFSAAYRVLGGVNYKNLAKQAYEYFLNHFIDEENGGAFWELNPDGSVYDGTKKTYGQAFAIYALSEYYQVFGEERALHEAISIYNHLERHVYDQENKGYYEILTQKWEFEKGKQVSNINPFEAACKTMNTHLHLLEAYTNLYRVWKDEGLKDQLREHIEVMVDKIIDPCTGHYKLYFNETWESLSPEVSYGHDIEGSWLLWEAAQVLGDSNVLECVHPISIKMAAAVFDKGWHKEGGILYEAGPEGVILAHRSWWVQAEAIVGFFNAWEMAGDEKYLDGAMNIWKFIDSEIVDHIHGGWFSYAVSDKRIANRIDGWTCPYHNARMSFEIIERVHSMIKD